MKQEKYYAVAPLVNGVRLVFMKKEIEEKRDEADSKAKIQQMESDYLRDPVGAIPTLEGWLKKQELLGIKEVKPSRE